MSRGMRVFGAVVLVAAMLFLGFAIGYFLWGGGPTEVTKWHTHYEETVKWHTHYEEAEPCSCPKPPKPDPPKPEPTKPEPTLPDTGGTG